MLHHSVDLACAQFEVGSQLVYVLVEGVQLPVYGLLEEDQHGCVGDYGQTDCEE